MPKWVWDKEHTGVDFQKNKEIVEDAKRYLEEMSAGKTDIREIIKMSRNPARRLMFMIRELHNLGYQRIRFYPHIGGAGYWRYIITSSTIPSNPADETDPADVDTVWNSLGSGEHYGWSDKEDDSIAELAAKFLSKYQKIAVESKGEDKRYVEWYRDVLERTGPDGIIYFWWDGSYEIPDGYLGVLNTGNSKKLKISYPYDYHHLTGEDTPCWLKERI